MALTTSKPDSNLDCTLLRAAPVVGRGGDHPFAFVAPMSTDSVAPALVLDAETLGRLEATLSTLCAPFAHGDPATWGRAVMRDATALVGGDRALFTLGSGEGVHIVPSDDEGGAAIAEYVEGQLWEIDRVLHRRANDRRPVYAAATYFTQSEVATDPLHQEWSAPHRLFGPVCIGVETGADGPIPAALHVYHDRERGLESLGGERGLALFRLLLPAFRAGIAAWHALEHRRTVLASTIDAWEDAVALCTPLGIVVHRNPAMARLLAADGEEGPLTLALHRAVRAAGDVAMRRFRRRGDTEGIARASSDVHVAVAGRHGAHTVETTFLPDGTMGSDPMVLVRLRTRDVDPLDTETLAHRFSLTPRQVTVALLLAQGLRNDAIAARLGTSPHTTRRHTEQVLAKLGVGSRAEVAARLHATTKPK